MKGQYAPAKLKKVIRRTVPMNIVLSLFNTYVGLKAKKLGYSISSNDAFYRISKGKQEIRLSRAQSIYLNDTLDNFDFYYSGVEPIQADGVELVDYSTPRWHKVKNFDMFPIFFPAVAEPIITTDQYIEFARLAPGAVVIDLGAYSGLTSILFDMAIPFGGQVIAVEADTKNMVACEQNFALYRNFSKRKIELIKSAIWRDDKGVIFSSEGSMGSSVVAIVGAGRGNPITVPSIRLDQLADQLKLSRVDFVKCDIEGGETEIFDCPMFFAKHSPKIMIECHVVDGISTSISCTATLKRFGYTCDLMTQRGYPLPLLACTPIRD
jgi:FkbM family methyltransferase